MRDGEFQLYSSLLIGAVVGSYAMVGTFNLSFFSLTAVVFIVLVSGARLLVGWGVRAARRGFVEEFEGIDRWVNNMSASEALQKAERLLINPKVFERKTAAEDIRDQRLAPLAMRFFSEYEFAKVIDSDACLDRSDVGPAKLLEGYIRIGGDLGFTEVVVLPGKEEVYIGDGSEAGPNELESYRSLYHWLIVKAWVLHREEVEKVIGQVRQEDS